jgi:DNA-binding NarL/FixJ family response regulator
VIRVLIVDDAPVIRAGVARILGPADGFDVVAECSDGDEVPDAVAAHRPDLVVMDIRMRRLDGIAATRLLRARPDGPPVLVLTTFEDDDVLWGAIDAGAAGFILKDSPAELMIAAARTVAGGGAWLDAAVTARVLSSARAPAEGARPRGTVPELTQRERDVLHLMAQGATNPEIATDLIVSEATVKSHVGAIFAKLGVRDRAAAIVFAYDRGIVVPDPHRPPRG